MEDVKVSNGADCQLEQKCDEKERFDNFMNVMVLIVEKYGQSVLQDLDCVA